MVGWSNLISPLHKPATSGSSKAVCLTAAVNKTCLEVDGGDVVAGTGRDLLSFRGCATCPVAALPLPQVRPLRLAQESAA